MKATVRKKVMQLGKNRIPFLLGLGVLFVCGAVFIFSGDSVPVVPHDQLDFVVPLSELRALHLGDDFFPEMMGGMPSSAAAIGIPGMELFYIILPSVYAYSVNLVLVLLLAYISMYLLLAKMEVRPWAAAVTAFMFAMLPFYSVYALSSMGIPLVAYAVILVVREDRIVLPLALILVYGLFSSFAWAGYAVCVALFVVFVVLAIRRLWRKSLKVFLLTAALFFGYVVVNIDTIIGATSSTMVGHRAEFSTGGDAFDPKNVIDLFVQGQYHAVSNHHVILLFLITVVACVGLREAWLKLHRRQSLPEDVMRLFAIILSLLILALVIALFKEFFTSDVGVGIRSRFPGSLRSFQLDRFYWLYPAIWYMGAGIAFELVMRIAGEKRIMLLGVVVVVLVASATLSISLPKNDVYMNLQNKMRGQEPSISWRQFFSETLFDTIEQDLNQRESGDQSSYKVASIAMHPYVALHNGFYTIDGYSVDYPLEYKYEFAKIIEPELDLSPGLYDYFWNWGSRCYIFSHENGDYVLRKDSGREIGDLRINVEAFKELGGRYIFSAVPINNAEAIGIEFIDAYSDGDSYYKVWVYEAI